MTIKKFPTEWAKIATHNESNLSLINPNKKPTAEMHYIPKEI